MESPAFGILVILAFGLLATVSGGIVYLTLVEWRDRRRRDRADREDRTSRRPKKAR